MSSAPAFQRARKPDERAHRQRAILEAAAALFDAEGLPGVTLNAVARRAGIAKSNLYRYFESREAMLLALLNEDQDAAVALVEEKLARLRGPIDARAVARVFAQVAVASPRFCVLQTALSGVLEQNLSEEAIAQYKRGVLRLGLRIGNALRAALPSLPARATGPFMRYLHAVIAGLYPVANPAPAAARVLRDAQFAALRFDFAEDMEIMLAAVLTSLCMAN
ncbi:MAG TPA: TetR family transcriptional regulator [Polyangia bacterium]|nr:TetR family transcriptional regulator [Polyangia bacterium]